MLGAFKLDRLGCLRPLAEFLARFPARRLSRHILWFDHIAGQHGLAAAGRYILNEFTSSTHIEGQRHVPRHGPLLVVANHPGMVDAIRYHRARSVGAAGATVPELVEQPRSAGSPGSETKVLPIVVSGVISNTALQHPLAKRFSDPKEREWAAATLQVFCRYFRDTQTRVAIGEPISAGHSALRAAIDAAMVSLLDRVLSHNIMPCVMRHRLA